MKSRVCFVIFIFCITSCMYQGCAQSTDQKIQEYSAIADTIINNIVKLESTYPQLNGIANSETFKTVTKSDDRTTINFHFFDSRARGMDKDYYLILDLNFYICKKAGCVTIAEKDLSIGDMQIGLSVDGKGNDALNDAIVSIIKKSKAAYEQK